MPYKHTEIEPKWQKFWESNSIFKAEDNSKKQKFYALDMFPYPSASGLHVGHAVGYTATDIVSRFYRMRGYNVLHPMGWDAFGLPAEQHAIQTGEHPAKITFDCINNYRTQLKRLGMSYDWGREFATCDQHYYKWTQWIFKILHDKGLAYEAEIHVNWCPELKTVLANDEVVDGKSERGGHPVFRVPMKQWMLKITAYAERLLTSLDKLDWPEATKEIQRNWIGKSTGARIKFAVKDYQDATIEVFTTRPDTLFGATYMVLSPEHPLVTKITTTQQKNEVLAYVEVASKKSDMDRTELNKEKSGAFTGAYASHPVTGEPLPIYIADYVLMTYGTGAIMAVPAHDERDFEFAKKYKIKIVQVVAPMGIEKIDSNENPFSGDGKLINSDFLNGEDVSTAKTRMIAFLEQKKLGEATINYKLRDWIFSRQRYWGEPIPILKDSQGKFVRLLNDDELPLTLPEVKSYEPTGDGQSPLAGIPSWVQRTDTQGKTYFLETHTMPGAAGSSWYFLRYCDPSNTIAAFAFDKAKYWMPVDLYIGGQEHAVGHLLYSRFWTKVLFDAGVSPVDEPFQKLVHQGMLCRFGAKMSKSKGNGINPDDIMIQYGADTLRVYEMFMGPITQSKEWDDSSIAGVYRFLSRIERHMLSESGVSLLTNDEPQLGDLKALHKTIKKVTEDIINLSFNTAIAQMMIFLNTVAESQCRSKAVMDKFIKVLAPFAPHLAEELWQKCILENTNSHLQPTYRCVSQEQWPVYDEKLVVDDEVKIGVQVNGKHRGEILLPKDSSQESAVEAAYKILTILSALDGKPIKKTIYVANRILNFVV